MTLEPRLRPILAISNRARDDGATMPARRFAGAVQARQLGRLVRSEEHTSELQSLMRISYAVFCLKKKKNETKTTQRTDPDHPNQWKRPRLDNNCSMPKSE